MLDKQITLICAMRYALGRMTYVVGSVVNQLIENWDIFTIADKTKIREEIFEAINSDSAGMDMDVKQWCKILDLGCGRTFDWGVGKAKCGFNPDVLCEYCIYNLNKESQDEK